MTLTPKRASYIREREGEREWGRGGERKGERKGERESFKHISLLPLR
jgi:hypothetical protein